MPKITKRLIDGQRSEANAKERFIWDEGDGALKGFGLRILPSGVMSYLVQYRNSEGRTRRLVVARVGEMTPDEARLSAADKLKAVRHGADPSAERHANRTASTVSEICDWYIEEAGKGGLLGRGGRRIKASTLAMDKSRIETHVKPLIGNRTVNSLRLDDIEALQTDIERGKSARSRKGRGGNASGGMGVAARTVGMLHTIFEAAQRKRLIKHNPATGVKKRTQGKHKRFLTLAEMETLGATMRELKETENRTGLAVIEALLMTGCRRNEILSLPKASLDVKACCIRFEDTKSGPQLRVIGMKAAQHLASQPSESECTWVFPADRGEGHFIGLPAVLQRICKAAGLAGVTVNSLRHSFAATAAEMGFSELTIAGLLGHSVPGVTARYAHVPDAALVTAANRVSARIALALAGDTGDASIIPLNGKLHEISHRDIRTATNQ